MSAVDMAQEQTKETPKLDAKAHTLTRIIPQTLNVLRIWAYTTDLKTI